MLKLGLEIGDHALLLIGAHAVLDTRHLAHPRVHSIGPDHEPCGDGAAVVQLDLHAIFVEPECDGGMTEEPDWPARLHFHRRQRALDLAALDDAAQLRDGTFVGTEDDLGAVRVAEDVHRFDVRDSIGRHTRPRTAVGEELPRTRTDGVDPAVPTVLRGLGGHFGIEQQRAQSARAHGCGEPRANQPGTNHEHIAPNRRVRAIRIRSSHLRCLPYAVRSRQFNGPLVARSSKHRPAVQR